MSNSPLAFLVSAMYEGATIFWPGLTAKQFEEVGKTVIDSRSGKQTWSIQEIEDALRAELTKRYGRPRR